MDRDVQPKNSVIPIKVSKYIKKIIRISTELLLGCRGKIENGLVQVGEEKSIKSQGVACGDLWWKFY